MVLDGKVHCRSAGPQNLEQKGQKLDFTGQRSKDQRKVSDMSSSALQLDMALDGAIHYRSTEPHNLEYKRSKVTLYRSKVKRSADQTSSGLSCSLFD